MTTYNNSNKWDEWLRAALMGDENAYRLLLTDLRPWLMAYFMKRVHKNTVEDLVQDTLMSLHSKRQTYNPDYPFGPWISAVARHRWIDHMRKNLKYIEMELDPEFPSQEYERDEYAKHDIKTLLELIPSIQAKIIRMVKLQEMSINEVSKKTGYSPSNVKIMVHRGMKNMITSRLKEVHYD
ncbi:MAG: sigma-70 family RNA polymerase sigma factor [Thiotrichales bacterium]|jgi:RNA polymerase sigma-70 factor (ECF subfamily)|nr:sigma-70 family RNA polymerase sigma factor [Thiotrichales bacterium]